MIFRTRPQFKIGISPIYRARVTNVFGQEGRDKEGEAPKTGQVTLFAAGRMFNARANCFPAIAQGIAQ